MITSKCNDGCSFVKYMSFLTLRPKQMLDNIGGPLVASTQPEETKGNIRAPCNLVEKKENDQLECTPVRIDKMNKYFLHLLEDKKTKDAESITKIFDSNHNKRPIVNQERTRINYREKNINFVGHCHQMKNGETPVAVQETQLANQSDMPRGKVSELVKTFEAKKTLIQQNKLRNDHNRISLNTNYLKRIVTTENVPAYQDDKQHALATIKNVSLFKENVPNLNSNLAITVKKDYRRTIQNLENNYNLQVSSNELYNRLLDHFYKFCDELLVKKNLENDKVNHEKSPVRKEMIVQNEKTFAVHRNRGIKENIFEERKCRGKSYKPVPSIVQVDRQTGGLKLKRLRSGVKNTVRCGPPNFTNSKLYDSRSRQNYVNKHTLRRVEPLRNRTFIIPSETFSTVTYSTDSSRAGHQDNDDDVIRIILPDDYDVSKLRNQIRAGHTRPLVAILQELPSEEKMVLYIIRLAAESAKDVVPSSS